MQSTIIKTASTIHQISPDVHTPFRAGRGCKVAPAFTFYTDEDEAALEEVAQWEDKLDLLGSEPDLAKLRMLMEEAPDTSSDLYLFAKAYYQENVPAAMQDWEDRLDAIGIWASQEELEYALASCPDPEHASAAFLAGVITHRLLEG